MMLKDACVRTTCLEAEWQRQATAGQALLLHILQEGGMEMMAEQLGRGGAQRSHRTSGSGLPSTHASTPASRLRCRCHTSAKDSEGAVLLPETPNGRWDGKLNRTVHSRSGDGRLRAGKACACQGSAGLRVCAEHGRLGKPRSPARQARIAGVLNRQVDSHKASLQAGVIVKVLCGLSVGSGTQWVQLATALPGG